MVGLAELLEDAVRCYFVQHLKSQVQESDCECDTVSKWDCVDHECLGSVLLWQGHLEGDWQLEQVDQAEQRSVQGVLRDCPKGYSKQRCFLALDLVGCSLAVV